MNEDERELQEKLDKARADINLLQTRINAYSEDSEQRTPDNLIPKLGEHPTNAAYFTTVSIIHPQTSKKAPPEYKTIDKAIDLNTTLHNSDGATKVGYEKPHQGVYFTHEQTWRLKGIALGNLLHSLTLAPGEATKVVVQDWTSKQTGQNEQALSQSERVTSQNNDNRAIHEVQNATAHEALNGQSSQKAISNSSSAGMSLLIASMGTSFSSALASAVNSSNSAKDASAEESQRIQQATEKAAESARTRRASVVKEVTQSESSQTTSRVVANYNHMHAMTVMYYEVLEVYEVNTKVVSSRDCLFIPLQYLSAKTLLEKHANILSKAANAAGMDVLASAIVVKQKVFLSSNDFPHFIQNIHTALSHLSSVLENTNAMLNWMPQVPDSHGYSANFQEQVSILERVKTATQKAHDDLLSLKSIENALSDTASLKLAYTALAEVRGGNPSDSKTISNYSGAIKYIQETLLPNVSEEPLKSQLSHYISQGEVCAKDIFDRLGLAVTSIEETTNTIAAINATDNIVEAVTTYLEYFNHAVWLEVLSPAVVHGMFKNAQFGGQAINAIIDPKPVAFTGNMVGFAYAKVSDKKDRLTETSSTVVIPTGGVFAEAVLGQSIAAEKIDLKRFWNWQESPIPLTPPELSPVSTSFKTNQMDLQAQDFATAQAELQKSHELPTYAGLAAMLETLAKGDTFKDMSGSDAAQALANAVAGYASAGEQHAQTIASQNFAKTMDVGEKLASGILTAGTSTLLGGLDSLKGTGILEKMLGLKDEKVEAALETTTPKPKTPEPETPAPKPPKKLKKD